jgi:hypothetical protein
MKQTIFQSAFLFFLCSVFLLSSFALDEEAAMTGFQYLDVPPAPRQIALGYAGAALGGPGFAYYNPAAPALLDRPYLAVGVAPRPYDYTIAYAEGAWTLSNLFFGANVSNHFVDGIIPADYQGFSTGAPGSYDGTLLSLCAGYKNENLGLGLSVNGLQEKIVNATSYGISESAGLSYWLLPQKLSLGAAVLNMGATTGGLDETKKLGQGAPLPRSGRAGGAWVDTLFGVVYTVAADIVYRDVGNKISSANQVIKRISVPVGVEVWPTGFVALRLGKRFNYETELLTFGAALRYSMIAFDVAFSVSSLVGDVDFNPYLSLSYTLPFVKKAASVAPQAKDANAAPQPSSAPTDAAAGINDSLLTPQSAPTPAFVPVHADSASTISEKPGATVAQDPVPQAPVLAPADSVKAVPFKR